MIDAWARLGGGYAIDDATAQRDARGVVDLEHLVLLTAVHGSHDARMVAVAVTWLSRYGSLVAEHRLCRLLDDGAIAPEATAGLGVILETSLEHARLHDRRRNLERAASRCAAASTPRAYYELDDENDVMRRRAKRRTSPIAARWNLWMEPIEPKFNALRGPEWVIAHNPGLAFRADFRGDLRATILLTLEEQHGAGASVSELSRRCGVTRTAVVNALHDLTLARRIVCAREGRVCRVAVA